MPTPGSRARATDVTKESELRVPIIGRKLVHHRQLASAAIEMIRRPNGEYVFLNINAHNDWLWLQRITGLRMVSAMADLLNSGALP